MAQPRFTEKAGEALGASQQYVFAQVLTDELPLLPLWTANALYAHHRRLLGFKPPADPAHLLWNADEWSVTP